MRAGRFGDALPFAERAVAEALACLPGHSVLASILLKLGRAADAEAVVARAAGFPTGSADAFDGLAFVSVELAAHERANALYRRAIDLEPHNSRGWYNLAASERSFGRLEAAEAACARAIGLDARQYPGYLMRSELRVQTVESNHLEELRRRLADPHLNIDGRIFLGYALAKELDDVQRFDEAFQWFSIAAQGRRSQFRYDVAADERLLRRIETESTARAAALGAMRDRAPDGEHAGCGTGAEAGAPYIFIVGLPRSGTTLVERLLTGLAGVRSNGETDNFSRALTAAAPATGRDAIARAARADPVAVADYYAQLARTVHGGEKVIDKLPTNYLYLGEIRRALPAARIVLVTRSPLDSCFAMFRALFGAAYPFSYDVEELARYYAAYAALMTHWRKSLGESLHEVRYEELVREPDRIGSALARHCRVAWVSAAADIRSNPSVSLSASAAQVRRPIYASSSGRWRHYRAHLKPLMAALRRHGVVLPEDA